MNTKTTYWLILQFRPRDNRDAHVKSTAACLNVSGIGITPELKQRFYVKRTYKITSNQPWINLWSTFFGTKFVRSSQTAKPGFHNTKKQLFGLKQIKQAPTTNAKAVLRGFSQVKHELTNSAVAIKLWTIRQTRWKLWTRSCFLNLTLSCMCRSSLGEKVRIAARTWRWWKRWMKALRQASLGEKTIRCGLPPCAARSKRWKTNIKFAFRCTAAKSRVWYRQIR